MLPEERYVAGRWGQKEKGSEGRREEKTKLLLVSIISQ